MTFAMAEQVQGGHGVVVEGHRHMVNLTAAAEINTHLHNWLKLPIHAQEVQ